MTKIPLEKLLSLSASKIEATMSILLPKSSGIEAPLVDAEKASRIRHIVKMKSQQIGLDDAALAELDATVLGLEGDVGQPV